jgi:DnaJ family protein C protein 2
MSLDEGSTKFKDWVARLDARLEKERAQVMESAVKGSGGRSKTGGGAEWFPADLQLLIKAVNLFPAGTSQRLAIKIFNYLRGTVEVVTYNVWVGKKKKVTTTLYISYNNIIL